MRQHGNHPVYQVYAGPPLKGLPIEGAVLLHIIGHIRNVHTQNKMLPVSSHRNRIIQILCILPVNGDADLLPKIETPLPVRLRHRLCNPLCLI